jgi:hypothetical protein
LYFQPLHQALNGTAGNLDALPVKLAPDLTGTVYPKVLFPNPCDIVLQAFVTLDAFWPPLRITLTGFMLVIRRRGDRQLLADRLDPVLTLMLVNKGG